MLHLDINKVGNSFIVETVSLNNKVILLLQGNIIRSNTNVQAVFRRIFIHSK